MRIINKQQIIDYISSVDLRELLQLQKDAFVSYSSQQIIQPLPLQMNFQKHHGDCHIKAGYALDSDIAVIKIATGFYNNSAKNLPPCDGLICVFSQTTGQILAILNDEGYITTLRTALAAIVAMEITPWAINNIGIVGSGGLATQLYKLISTQYRGASVHMWTRKERKREELKSMSPEATIHDSISSLIKNVDVIVTCTASSHPIFDKDDIANSQLHIIALGSDEVGKQELDTNIIRDADQVVIDSYKQAACYGECYNAIQAGIFNLNKADEIGKFLQSGNSFERGSQLIVTDFTGLAAQDIMIVSKVIELMNL